MRGLARLDAPGRLTGVDLARGLAVIGMFAAHVTDASPFDVADPSSWLDVVNGRSSILFATLAGVSIGLVTGGPKPVRGPVLAAAAGRLVVRGALLWVLGIMLVSLNVPILVILPAYAVLFVLAIPFLALPARVVLPTALGLGLVTPFLLAPVESLAGGALGYGAPLWVLVGWHYPFLVWIAFVLAGLGLARAGLHRRRVQLWALGGGAALAAVGYGLASALPAEPDEGWQSVWTAEAHSSGVLEVLGSGGFAIAVIALCLLVTRGFVAAVVLPLRAVGSMPLTAYTAQLLVLWYLGTVVVGDVRDLGGVGDAGGFWILAVGVTAGCTVWALAVGRGPLEWAIDRVSTTLVPAPDPAQPRDRERIAP